MTLILMRFLYKFLVAPGKPINVTASKTCKNIQMSWQPPLDNGGMKILNYVITANISRNVNADTRMHKIEHVFDPDTTYRVNVSARNRVGVGPKVVVSVTTDKYCKFHLRC